MPRGKWTAKDERKFEHILESCRFGAKPRSKKTCERIAAATVNRDRKTRSGLGDVLRRSERAQQLLERMGIRLVASSSRQPGKHAYEVVDSDGNDIGRMVLSVVKFRDVPDDDGFDMRDGLEVTGIELEPSAQRKGIGTKLYEVAADAACEMALPLVSDRVRSRFAEAFWRKQSSKGRAYAVEGSGSVFPGPVTEVAEYLQRTIYETELRAVGNTPAGRRKAQDRADADVEAWLSKLPAPPTSDSWTTERYVLEDSCRHARDLSRISRRTKKR